MGLRQCQRQPKLLSRGLRTIHRLPHSEVEATKGSQVPGALRTPRGGVCHKGGSWQPATREYAAVPALPCSPCPDSPPVFCRLPDCPSPLPVSLVIRHLPVAMTDRARPPNFLTRSPEVFEDSPLVP